VNDGYAVFDIETTGFRLHPDSIVEIAVVHVDADGAITGSWDTLLRPRDGEVGPTHVHGVSRAMVEGAPSFGDAAGSLYGLFAGRIPVAHRIAQFDGRFLNAHFTWSGIDTDAFTGGLCTWQLASRHLPLDHHTLKDCCEHLGIELVDAHQALTDTVATAQLLGHFIRAGHTRNAGGRVIPALAGTAASAAPGLVPGGALYPRRRAGVPAQQTRPAFPERTQPAL
jgi:DNA polymerase III epsilon subunit-like protein